MPRSRSTAIQSERTRRRSPRARTSPASWIAPPNSSNFSVKVVLPASGCEMIAKMRRRAISSVRVRIKLRWLPGLGRGSPTVSPALPKGCSPCPVLEVLSRADQGACLDGEHPRKRLVTGNVLGVRKNCRPCELAHISRRLLEVF
jgi:hypothetical protein